MAYRAAAYTHVIARPQVRARILPTPSYNPQKTTKAESVCVCVCECTMCVCVCAMCVCRLMDPWEFWKSFENTDKYKERSRLYRRTVFDDKDWIEFR